MFNHNAPTEENARHGTPCSLNSVHDTCLAQRPCSNSRAQLVLAQADGCYSLPRTAPNGRHHARPGRQPAQARHGRPAIQPAQACRLADSPLVHATDRCKGAGPAGGARAAQRRPTAAVMCVATDRPGGGGEGAAPCRGPSMHNPLQNGGAKRCCVNAPAGGLVCGLASGRGVESCWRCHLRH